MANTLLHIVGVPTQKAWSRCVEFSHDTLTLCFAITVTVDSADAGVVGAQYVDEIERWFANCPDFATGLSFLSRYTLPVGCEAVCLLFQGDNGLFSVIGAGKVSVARAGSGIDIVETGSGAKSMQGKVYPCDILVFGTGVFARTYSMSILGASDLAAQATKLSTEEAVVADPHIAGGVFTIPGVMPTPATNSPASVTVVPPAQPAPPSPKPMVNEPTVQSSVRKRTPRLWFPVGVLPKKIALLMCVILMFAGVFIAIQRFILHRRETRIRSVLVPLQERFSKANLDSLSRLERERLLSDLRTDEAQARVAYSSDPAIMRELVVFEKNLESAYLQVAARKEIDHLPVFYDFRLSSTDFVASQIAYDAPGKLAVFLDASRSKLVTLALEKKQPQSVTITSQVGTVKAVTVIDRKAYVLGGAGVYEVSLPLDVEGKMVASSSANWQTPKLIGSFANNAYVYDQEARQVWRYDRSDFTASPSAWLRGKEGVDLESINGLAIDGDLWMSTIQGKVYKFSRGDRTGFSFSDILSPPTSSIALFTAEDLSHLYILEPKEKRLLVFEKSGKYVSSIVSEDFASATGIIADEELKKAYVLAGSLVYEVEL